MPYQSILMFLSAAVLAGTVGAAPAASGRPPSLASLQDLQQAEGDYHLPNGHQVSVFAANGRLYAALGNRDRREFVPNGDGSFATDDHALSLRFREGPEGTQIVLSVTRQAAATGNRELRQLAAVGELEYGAEPALAQAMTDSLDGRQVASAGQGRR